MILEKNPLKEKLKKGQLSIGSWLTIGNTSTTEIMSRSGFEWLVIDMEHSSITLDIAQQMIQVIEGCGAVPLVRVGENNPNLIKRVMDAGSYGVIVPMVNSKEDAIKAVEAVRYPPEGKRGVGLARAQGYGLEFEKYKKWLKDNVVVVVQIEHIKAVENLEEILNVDGVDAFIVGPYDLSGSLGIPGKFDSPEMKRVMGKILTTAKKIGKVAGIHVVPTSAEDVNTAVKDGYGFIAFSLDCLFLADTCKNAINSLKRV